jgi:hypothetical protein
VTLAPGQLEATGTSALAMKGGPDPHVSSLSLWSATPGQHWLLHLSVGMGTQYWPMTNGGANATSGQYTDSVSFGYHLWYRITDRLSWSVPFPAFSYRFGNPGSVEVMPSMGLKSDSFSTAAGPSLGFSTDVDARIWTASNQRITLGAGVYLPAYKDTSSPLFHGVGIGNDVDPSVRAGYSWTIKHLVTLSAGLGYVQDYYRGALSSEWVQPRGNVDVRVSPNASLNLGVLYADEVHQHLGTYENVSVGTTISF